MNIIIDSLKHFKNHSQVCVTFCMHWCFKVVFIRCIRAEYVNKKDIKFCVSLAVVRGFWLNWYLYSSKTQDLARFVWWLLIYFHALLFPWFRYASRPLWCKMNRSALVIGKVGFVISSVPPAQSASVVFTKALTSQTNTVYSPNSSPNENRIILYFPCLLTHIFFVLEKSKSRLVFC